MSALILLYGRTRGDDFMSIYDEIGQNITMLRKEKGLTQEQLALNADMSISHLRAIEHGKGNPSIRTLKRLSDALDVSLNTLTSIN